MPGAVLGDPAESMGNKNGNLTRRSAMSPLKVAFIRLIRPDYEDLRNASAIRAMRDYARTRMMYGSRQSYAYIRALH